MRVFLVASLLILAACSGHAEPTQSGGCVIGGCGGQLCAPAGKPSFSTCEWTPAYGCYQAVGECAMQADGKCGWTETQELKACLANPEGYARQLNAPPDRGTDPLHPHHYRR